MREEFDNNIIIGSYNVILGGGGDISWDFLPGTSTGRHFLPPFM